MSYESDLQEYEKLLREKAEDAALMDAVTAYKEKGMGRGPVAMPSPSVRHYS